MIWIDREKLVNKFKFSLCGNITGQSWKFCHFLKKVVPAILKQDFWIPGTRLQEQQGFCME